MKFGGTSIGGGAEQVRAVAEIVRARLNRKPVVVVSALAGVTDLLVRSIEVASVGDLEGLEPLLADIERRYRWSAASVETPGRRHTLELEIAGAFEDLRERLRSTRILGECTPRARDAILAFGDLLSARVVSAAFEDCGVEAERVDAREVIVTDASHGAACPERSTVAACCAEKLQPLLDRDRVPVMAGFVGATTRAAVTTLGRGGSDLTAAVLGLAMEADEIQIWTDVDGLMTADPRWVPEARTLAQVSFAEAAELAFQGARVLHPASIAPAVEQRIPVRVLNALNPESDGTWVRSRGPERPGPGVASLAHRSNVTAVRVTDSTMRGDPELLSTVLVALEGLGVARELVVASAASVTVVVSGTVDFEPLARALGPSLQVEVTGGKALVCAVGSGMDGGAARHEVLDSLADLAPDVVVCGASRIAVSALLPESALADALPRLHRRFFGRNER